MFKLSIVKNDTMGREVKKLEKILTKKNFVTPKICLVLNRLHIRLTYFSIATISSKKKLLKPKQDNITNTTQKNILHYMPIRVLNCIYQTIYMMEPSRTEKLF